MFGGKKEESEDKRTRADAICSPPLTGRVYTTMKKVGVEQRTVIPTSSDEDFDTMIHRFTWSSYVRAQEPSISVWPFCVPLPLHQHPPIIHTVSAYSLVMQGVRALSHKKSFFPCIPLIKIRRSRDRLIFDNGNPYTAKTASLYIDTPPNPLS